MSSLLLLLAAPVLAADPPCYGHVWDNRVEGDYLWVEWEDGTIEQAVAESTLGIMEDAWEIYRDDLGFRMPEPQLVTSVLVPLVPGASGRCTTTACDGTPRPRIELYYPSAFEGTRVFSTGPHELGHAVEYAYMGDYVDSIESWEWWMEGVATWFEMYGSTNGLSWKRSMEDYVASPHLALQHGAAGLLDPDISGQMYGTALLAHYLDTEWGGPGAVRATWEYGETVSGTEVWFPDALADQGIDFEAFWPDYLSRMPTLDVEQGVFVDAVPPRVAEIDQLPAEGSGDEDLLPQGLGFNVIRFSASAGGPGQALSVAVDVDPDVPWHAVLVRADGGDPGADVLDWVALGPDEETAGRLSGWIGAFEGNKPVFLVVSPELDTQDGQDYQWSAEVIADPSVAACGCATGRPAGAGTGLLIGMLVLCRRIRRDGAARSA